MTYFDDYTPSAHECCEHNEGLLIPILEYGSITSYRCNGCNSIFDADDLPFEEEEEQDIDIADPDEEC